MSDRQKQLRDRGTKELRFPLSPVRTRLNTAAAANGIGFVDGSYYVNLVCFKSLHGD